MPIFQEGFNFPNVLGKLTFPPATVRSGPIAQKAMALIAGETPIHLAQKFAQKFRGQLSQTTIIPILDRPHPYLDQIKARPTMVNRKKLIGVFGIIDPLSVTRVREQIINGNIPRPNPPAPYWSPGRNIANLPSAKGDLTGTSGPTRTLHGSSRLHVIM